MAESGCARPTGASVGKPPDKTNGEPQAEPQEIRMKQAIVGKPAPDFEAPAYYKSEFTRVKLSEYLGHWTLLCFYPGDFTFV